MNDNMQHHEKPDALDKLKAERVQATLRQRLKAERVQEELKSMPGWKLLPDGKGIDRLRDFPDMTVAATYVGFAEMLAGRCKLPLSVYMHDGQVLLTVRGPKGHGRYGRVNEAVIELARQLG